MHFLKPSIIARWDCAGDLRSTLLTLATFTPRTKGRTVVAGRPTWQACGGSAQSLIPVTTTKVRETAGNLGRRRPAGAGRLDIPLAKRTAVELPLLANLLRAVGFAGRIERFPPSLLPGGTPVTQVDGKLVQY